MNAVTAFQASDGTLHQTPAHAGARELMLLGFDGMVVDQLIERREQVAAIFQQVDGQESFVSYMKRPLASPEAA